MLLLDQSTPENRLESSRNLYAELKAISDTLESALEHTHLEAKDHNKLFKLHTLVQREIDEVINAVFNPGK